MLIFTFWELGQESTWEHTFHTSDGCYSIVTSILDVITAMETGYALPIIMAPNPISDNQQTIINREWTASEQGRNHKSRENNKRKRVLPLKKNLIYLTKQTCKPPNDPGVIWYNIIGER